MRSGCKSINRKEPRAIANANKLPREFYFLTATSITLFLASQTTQPILPLYIVEKGATTFELGVIISLLSFTAIAAKIPLGMLAERVGRWPIIPAVVVGQAVSMLLYSVVPDYTWFYPIRIFHAFILAAFAPTALAITQDLSPPHRRGTTMGTFLTSVGVAATFGPFLCTFLVDYVSYPQLFQIAAVIPFLGLMPFLLSRRRSAPKSNRLKTSLGESLKAIVSSRSMLALSYLRLTFSFTNAFFITLFAVYTEESLLFTASLIAFFFGIKGITNMLSRIPSGRLADRVGCRRPLILAFTLLAITFLIISEARDVYLLALAMVIYGVAHGMRAVSEWSMLSECAPSEAGSVATAYLSTVFNVGAAFGAVVAGALSVVLDAPMIFRLAAIIVFSGVFTVGMLNTSKSS